MKRKWFLYCTYLALVLMPQSLSATPSSHIWTPSTDIQAHGTFHLTSDLYVPTERDASGSRPSSVTNVGLQAGVWPIKDQLGAELGFDHISGYGELDDYPFYFNAKFGTPENVLFSAAPALAFGGYYFGTEQNKTDQNTYYLKAAKTLSVNNFLLGRFSLGWFWGNPDLLLDGNSNSDADGVLLTWERALLEVSDKLGLCLDYQGTDSGLGALVPAFSWKFADNTSVSFGYVVPNNNALAEQYVVELDVDFGA